MTEVEKRKILGIISESSYVIDYLTGKMTIKTNEFTENMAVSSTAEKVFEIFKSDNGFYWRHLINAVEIGPDVTVLNNGVLADSCIKKVVVPSNVKTIFAYALCYSNIDEIVFESENIALKNAVGMLEGLNSYTPNSIPKISCKHDALLNSLLVNAETLGITGNLIINEKPYKEYTKEELEIAKEKYDELEPFEEQLSLSIESYDNIVNPSEFKNSTFVEEYGIKPILITSSNFSLDTLTGVLIIIGNNLSEDEILKAMKKVNELVKPKKEINPAIITNEIKFSPKVFKCPETAFCHYENVRGIYLPKNVTTMGLNSFVFAGKDNYFWVAIENPDFKFLTSAKSINKAGLHDGEGLEKTHIDLYYNNGQLDHNILKWIAPDPRSDIHVHPYSAFNIDNVNLKITGGKKHE